jgi:glycosyltransferase involved in cell wall biosynthesis
VDAKLFEKNGEPSGFEKDWAPLIRETIKEGSYILSVSNLARHKNYETLIYAYAILDPALRQKHKLLIVGENTGAYYDELSALARQLGIRANIVFAGRLDHKHMPYIYKRAAVLVFPSRLESFGLPILEAMASSVPVVAANAAALPEVGGDACLYFDPDNPAELADLMRRVLTDTCLRSHLIHREKNRVQHFSWIKTARETLAIFKKVCMPG